ncbi:reticulophagy regulator 1 [Solea solea]|uniref:reticulophagy regulator 1 n=1 Tax=Solea solea TaxID=90069 RepID=UPI002729616A|nr:reticulophagy regulator 1 [Solea solea]
MRVSREAGTASPPGPPGQTRGDKEAPPRGAGSRLSGLVNWRQRPWRTSALFTAANIAMWFVTFSSLSVYSLLAIILAVLVAMVTIRDVAQSIYTGVHSWRSRTSSWQIMDSGAESGSGPGPQLSDSLRLFLRETSAFKQQNPGKFCLLVCSLCTFFAVIGRYIPGLIISYVLVLCFFLWPLVSSHEVGLWLEPVLQKLDFGITDFLQRIKANHEKRMRIQAQTEKEGIESDLSSMFPKLDSTVCKEMSVSDTEVSDVTWTDNGTFNLSEGHTPQTENSEDLDREEAFSGGLPEFPSHDNGTTTNGDDDYDLSLGLPAPHSESNQTFPRPPRPRDDPSADKALELVNQIAGDFIAAAVTAAIQERIETAVGLAAMRSEQECHRLQESNRLLELDEDSDSEVEDFELLDQSELEHLDRELGLEEKKSQSDEAPSTGFFTKLLRRH